MVDGEEFGLRFPAASAHITEHGEEIVRTSLLQPESTVGENVVALGRIEGKTRKAAVPIDVPFAHVWTVREGYLQRLRAFTDTALLAHALAKD